MGISDYFSKQYGSTVAPGQGSYSYGGKYGEVSLWRPKASVLDMGTNVLSSFPGIGGGGVVTGSVDGGAPAVDWLKGLTGAVLANMGARGDPEPQQQFTPVAYSTGGQGGDETPWLVIGLGAVAVGAVIYAVAGSAK